MLLHHEAITLLASLILLEIHTEREMAGKHMQIQLMALIFELRRTLLDHRGDKLNYLFIFIT